MNDNFLSKFEIISPTEITWSYGGNNEQGEYTPNTYFTIRQATQSEIKKDKCKSYTKTD